MTRSRLVCESRFGPKSWYEENRDVQLELDRFLALVCRELSARESFVVDPDAGPPAPIDERELRCLLPDGRGVAVRFDAAPTDRDVKQRRLEMLASTFDTVVEEGPARGPRTRPPVARALQDELAALAVRADAINAFVVDANSPIMWGAAQSAGLTAEEKPTLSGANDVEVEDLSEAGARIAALSRTALVALRGLRDVAMSRKGKHVRHVELGGPAPFVAHSFAGIYLLVVVFDKAFDELRAERAIVDALPRVERFVLALPPLDPSPMAGARAMAVRSRRR